VLDPRSDRSRVHVGARLGHAFPPGVERGSAHLLDRRRPSRLHGHLALDRSRARRARRAPDQPRSPEPGQRPHPGRSSAGPRRGDGGTRSVRVHLIAACGVGMSALAGLLREGGDTVTGSDENVYPPASTLLAELGIPVSPGYDPARLDGVELVVCGNAVTRTNAEAEAARVRGLRMTSMPAALEEMFLAGRSPLVIAGTHGKTTSTAMLAWVLARAGRDPGFLIGGGPRDLGRSFAVGSGRWFVIEGDEYDSAYFDKEPKFLHYRPAAVLLTAVEFDHADIYRDLDHVKSAFRKLLGILRPDAALVACGDFPHLLDVVGSRGARLFGLEERNDWRVTELEDGGARRFTIRERGRAVCRVTLQLPGAINARNALGVLLLAGEAGGGWEEAAAPPAEFRGVRRRQEVVAEAR